MTNYIFMEPRNHNYNSRDNYYRRNCLAIYRYVLNYYKRHAIFWYSYIYLLDFNWNHYFLS